MSEINRLRQLRDENNLEAVRDLALDMLHKSRRREFVDAALNALNDVPLDNRARLVLREKAWYYFENISQDKTVAAREQIIRFLNDVGSPDDSDLYLRGVNTYEIQPMLGEVAQNLRAVSLVGLALADSPSGSIYATKLLSEIENTSIYNGEPAITAVNLLSSMDQVLPIYQYLLIGGLDALEIGLNEVVGKALESLGGDFPTALYPALVDLYVPRDRALVSMGIFSYVVEHKIEALYPALETIITSTRHHELHNYAVVTLAASRDQHLIDLLYRLAKVSPKHRIANFTAAVELTPGTEKESLLELLRKRI